MERARPGNPSLMQVIIVSLFVGGIVGYLIRMVHERYILDVPSPSSTGASRPGGSPPGGSPPGGSPQGGAPDEGGRPMGGGAMGGGMGGGGARPHNGADLARLVGALDTIQKVQAEGLSSSQKTALLPILKSIQSSSTISDENAGARLAQINKILTSSQKSAVEIVSPPRRGRGRPGGPPGMGGPPGGRGGMPGAGGPGGMMGAGPGGGPPGGGQAGMMAMMMGGGGPGGTMGGGGDPNRPFASDPAQKSLTDLLTQIQR